MEKKLFDFDTVSDQTELKELNGKIERMERQGIYDGIHLAKTARVTDEIKNLADLMKEFTDIDFGKDNKDFLGGQETVDRLKATVKSYQDSLVGKLGPRTQDERARESEDKKNLANILKGIYEYGNAMAIPEIKLEAQVKQLGSNIKPEQIEGVKDKKYFDALLDEANTLELQLKNRPSEMLESEVKKLEAKIGALRTKALNMLPVGNWFTAINDGLAAIGLEAFREDQFAAFSDEQVLAFAAAIDVAKSAVNNFNNLESLGITVPFKDKEAALQAQLETKRKVKNEKEVAEANRLANVKSKDPFGKLRELQDMGFKPPVEALRNSKTVDAWTDLQIGILKAEAAQKSFILLGADGKSFEPIARNLDGLNKQMDEFVARGKEIEQTLDSLMGKLSETGIEINDVTFSNMGAGAKRALSTIGFELESISQRLSFEHDPASQSVAALIARRTVLYKQASEYLINTLHSTGDSIVSALNSLGVSDSKQVAKILDSAASARLLAIHKSISALKLSGKDPYSESFKNNLKEIVALEKEASELRDKALDNYSSKLANVNDVFKISMDESQFAELSDGFVSSISSIALTMKTKLAEMLEGNVSMSVAKGFFKAMKGLTKIGTYITFFNELRQSTEAAFTMGAKNAFEKLKEVTGDTLDFEEYLSLPQEFRTELNKQLSDIEMFDKALEIEGLDPKYMAILEQVKDGIPISKALEEFWKEVEALGDGNLASALMTPSELFAKAGTSIATSAGSMAESIEAIERFLRGDKAPIKTNIGPTPDEPDVEGVKTYRTRSLEVHKALEKEREKVSNNVDTMMNNITYSVQKATKAVGNNDFDDRIVSLASPDQLHEAAALSSSIKEQEAIRKDAIAKGTEDALVLAKNAQIKIDEFKYELDRIPKAIADAAVAAREAGLNFGSDMKSSFGNALADLLHGKEEDDDGMFKTFFKSLATSFTDGIINTFSESVSEKLMGKDSPFGKILQELGKGVYELISKVFESITSATSGGGAKFNWLGAIFGGVKAIFGGGGGVSMGTTDPSGMVGLAGGGMIYGRGSGTSDSILAMLSNKEYVINAASTARYLPLIEAINKNKLPKFASGGLLGSSTAAILTQPKSMDGIKFSSNKNEQQVFNIAITGDISKQTKTEIYKMLPTIANGVNAHNKEQGNK
jgi:hypothetical protein